MTPLPPKEQHHEPGTPLVIVGAGGHGRETVDIVRAINAASPAEPAWNLLGLVADEAEPALLARVSTPYLGTLTEALRTFTTVSYVIGIGRGAAREQLDGVIQSAKAGWTAATLVHPLASIGADVELAPGVVLAAGARVTTNVRLGRHTQLNVNAVISHDCRVGDFVTCSPGSLVNGNNTLDHHVFLGTGAVVTPGRRLGHGAVVGAGAVVVDDVGANATVKGVPAR